MTLRLGFFTVTAGALLATFVSAQTLPRLSSAAISPGVDTFIVSYGNQLIGHSIQATEVVTEGGRQMWRQGYAFESVGGEVSTDTLWLDAESLLPIREVRTNTMGRFVVTYGLKEVVTVHTPPGLEPTATRTPVDGPLYASASLELLARSLPLAGGLQAPVALWYGAPSGRNMVVTAFRVPRADSLRSKDGVVRPVWIVTVGPTGEQTTFWIDQVDRRVLQFDTEEGSAVIQFRREP